MTHKIYESIPARQSGMDYSPVILFETSLVNMDETKVFTERNQPGKSNQKQQRRCRCGSKKHLRITSKYFPVGISYRKAQKLSWEMGLYLAETKKAAEDAAS